jgi:hypothetical protein
MFVSRQGKLKVEGEMVINTDDIQIGLEISESGVHNILLLFGVEWCRAVITNVLEAERGEPVVTSNPPPQLSPIPRSPIFAPLTDIPFTHS